MSAPPPGQPFSQGDSTAPWKYAAATDSADLLMGVYVEVVQQRWQARLQGLQEWVCELLIKNQQLRMAVMEMEARRLEDQSRRNA